MTSNRPFAAVILAAGRGTRMKSDLHKVLHPIAGRPMLLHLLETVDRMEPAAKVIVVGAQGEQVEAAVAGRGATVVAQDPQLGTAHAVLQAKAALDGFDGDILILYGDVPLVPFTTLNDMLAELDLNPDAAAVVLAFRTENPTGYGRILADESGRIVKMVEQKDASAGELEVRLCNSGMLAARARDLWPLLDRVGNENAASEYYLPDIVMLAAADGRPSMVIEGAQSELTGVNSRAELANLEATWQRFARAGILANGVTLIDPDTVWFSHDTSIGPDTIVEPNVVFGPGVTIGDDVRIRAFSHIEGATIAPGAEIGPFARLRPGAEIGEQAKVGNFVEVKKTRMGKGAKANHLSYLGDADIGPGANIGAGTITCNYDGYFKYRTSIGAGAFIGSNTALVAPVSVGAGALVAAGSVIVKDVPADAVALARGAQVEKPGRAARFREVMSEKKKKQS